MATCLFLPFAELGATLAPQQAARAAELHQSKQKWVSMSASLPPPVRNYFSGKNARDVTAAVSGFADYAVVEDEGGRHTGPIAIRTWIEGAIATYDDRADVSSVVARGDDVEVIADVTGTFPGSPIALRFNFTLKDDQIILLRIAP